METHYLDIEIKWLEWAKNTPNWDEEKQEKLNEFKAIKKALILPAVVKSFNASFKKGDIVLIDGKERRIVIEEFKNGMVELKTDKGYTLIGKRRLSLATKSI